MNERNLKPFQIMAADQIFERYQGFKTHPRGQDGKIPFFQSLSAITGSGKTAILCRVLRQIFDFHNLNGASIPLVLWTTKHGAVVKQTADGLRSRDGWGGLLNSPEDSVFALNEVREDLIGAIQKPVIVVATLASFHRNVNAGRDALRVHRKGEISESTWGLLQKRGGRDLLVVYDESHNFNANQDATLRELAPQGYLLSSGTARDLKHAPDAFDERVLGQAENIFRGVYPEKTGEEGKDWLTTRVRSRDVVESGLIKPRVYLNGTDLPMEECVNLALNKLSHLQNAASDALIDFTPKAIFVCNTNVSSTGQKDDNKTPFTQRKGRAIVLWRYLTEKCDVSVDDVAIYAKVRANKKILQREGVHIFQGGENDYDEFRRGKYSHIIFNLALQEGWDDPACYVAYIDKTMRSRVQIRQVIGRVLRQPRGVLLENEQLNTAYFYVRVDNEKAFSKAVDGLEKELGAEYMGNIDIQSKFLISSESINRQHLEPKCPGFGLPRLEINAEDVSHEIIRIYEATVKNLLKNNAKDNESDARMEKSVIQIGKRDNNADGVRVVRTSMRTPSAKLPLWWATELIGATIDRRVSDMLDYKSDSFPSGAHDYGIGRGSPAWNELKDSMKKIARLFYQNSRIDLNAEENSLFGFYTRDISKGDLFQNGLYDVYGGMNLLETEFAVEIDKKLNERKHNGCCWHRNISRSGYGIPLLLEGGHHFTYPDFLIWKNPYQPSKDGITMISRLICVDTKGEHLLVDAKKSMHKHFYFKDHGHDVVIFYYLLSKNRRSEEYCLWHRPEQGDPVEKNFQDIKKALDHLLGRLHQDF